MKNDELSLIILVLIMKKLHLGSINFRMESNIQDKRAGGKLSWCPNFDNGKIDLVSNSKTDSQNHNIVSLIRRKMLTLRLQKRLSLNGKAPYPHVARTPLEALQ